MRRLITVVLLLTAATSLAHIKLAEPTNINVTDMYGSPNKTAPCGGAGSPTGIITPVEAGSDLKIVWHEPIFHPGHFRVSVAQTRAEFVTPIPVLTNSGTNCSTAPVQSPVMPPTLFDGLFASHTDEPDGGFVVHVRVPDMECANCTLQVMQFMSSHPPPCFYYQCAALRIFRDAGTGADAGAVLDAGAGQGGGSAVGGGAASGGGSATGGGSDDAGATGGGSAVATGGGTMSADAGTDPGPQGGCSCGVTPGMGFLGMALVLMKRRRMR